MFKSVYWKAYNVYVLNYVAVVYDFFFSLKKILGV